MNENENNANVAPSTPIFTVKNIIRFLVLFCFIFVFCPMFTVSCSSIKVNLSATDAISGISVYGTKVADGHPIMLIVVLLPIAIAVMTFVKQIADKISAIVITACAGVDTVVWIVFRIVVKNAAEENGFKCSTSLWYFLNIIFLILIILITVMVLIKKINFDSDMKTFIMGGGVQNSLNEILATTRNLQNNQSAPVNPNVEIIGYCSTCGKPIAITSKFCKGCGTPVPESLIAAAQMKKAMDASTPTVINNQPQNYQAQNNQVQ